MRSEPGSFSFAPELALLVSRLERARPVPSEAFRTSLRERLVVRAPAYNPARLGLAALAGGVLLLLAGVLSVAGLGPLAA